MKRVENQSQGNAPDFFKYVESQTTTTKTEATRDSVNLIALTDFLYCQSNIMLVFNKQYVDSLTQTALQKLLLSAYNSEAWQLGFSFLKQLTNAVEMYMSARQIVRFVSVLSQDTFPRVNTWCNFILQYYDVICNSSSIKNYIQYYKSDTEIQAQHPLIYCLKNAAASTIQHVNIPEESKRALEKHFIGFIESLGVDTTSGEQNKDVAETDSNNNEPFKRVFSSSSSPSPEETAKTAPKTKSTDDDDEPPITLSPQSPQHSPLSFSSSDSSTIDEKLSELEAILNDEPQIIPLKPSSPPPLVTSSDSSPARSPKSPQKRSSSPSQSKPKRKKITPTIANE